MWKRLWISAPTVASFTKEVNPGLAKRPLGFNGRLANRGLTSLERGHRGQYLSTRYHILDPTLTLLWLTMAGQYGACHPGGNWWHFITGTISPSVSTNALNLQVSDLEISDIANIRLGNR